MFKSSRIGLGIEGRWKMKKMDDRMLQGKYEYWRWTRLERGGGAVNSRRDGLKESKGLGEYMSLGFQERERRARNEGKMIDYGEKKKRCEYTSHWSIKQSRRGL